jgi:putative membrane protein
MILGDGPIFCRPRRLGASRPPNPRNRATAPGRSWLTTASLLLALKRTTWSPSPDSRRVDLCPAYGGNPHRRLCGEAFLIERPSVHMGVFGLPYVPAAWMWTFGVGFHNLFRVRHGRRRHRMDERQRNRWPDAGDLHLPVLGLGGIVLVIADRLGFGGERGKSIGGAVGESVPPLVALLASLL